MTSIAHFILGSVLAALALPALAQTQDVCKSPTKPSVALMKRLESATYRYKGSEALSPKHLLDSGVRWTCSKDTEATCCQNIPLTLLLDATGSACAVQFPYGELAILRDSGRFKPKLSWLVKQAASPPGHVFGSEGIQIIPQASLPSPVDPSSSPNRCRYDGSTDRFQCRGNGKKNAKADHIANVFPAGHLDDPAFRCGNVDPIIINSN